MNRILIGASCAFLACLGWPGRVPAADDPRDLPTEVRAIFSAKCAACHGPNLAKPKGRFGYVLDLERIAGNREMVVPSSPEESELWELVSRGEMPPADSPTGPLSARQKDVIHAWIAAGAPTVASGAVTAQSPKPEDRDEVNSAPPPSLVNYTAARLGNLHIPLVHFPIALLITAALGELWSTLHGSRVPTPAVRFCVLLGAASALASAAFGWLHAWNGYGAGMAATLDLHGWIGTAAAVWAAGTALFSEWEERRGVRSQAFRAWLLFGALLVGAAGHLGGVLVHGEDFLTGG
ncbi:MAG: c-type cytochrome domain-containing protein [Gemmataceae bacterium]